MPLINVDFPEPETPEITVNDPSDIFKFTDFKLFPLAPSSSMK